MDKRLLLLALLQSGPLSGYRLHQIIESHSELYAGLPQPTVYFLLRRMQEDGLLRTTSEPGARGRTGERLLYSVTPSGRRAFMRLMREAAAAEPEPLDSVGVANILLRYSTPTEATKALSTRRDALQARRHRAAHQLSASPGNAADLLLSVIDAELAWLDRAFAALAGRE